MAKNDMESGFGLEKKYMDLLMPIYELIRSVTRAASTETSGFNETYRCHSKAQITKGGV